MKKRIRAATLIVAIGGLIIGVSGCGSDARSAGSDGLVHVSLRLDWSWGAQHAGYVVAQELGYYKEAGLDVEIDEGQGSSTTGQLVASGRADFGVVAAGQVLVANSTGLPLRAFATIAQKSPTTILYNKKLVQPASLDDLEGHSISVTTTSTTYNEFQAVASSNDLDLSKIKVVSAGTAATQAFVSGEVDTHLGLSYLDGPQAELAGVDVGYLPLSDFGLDVPFTALVTNEDFLNGNADEVAAFAKATERGWEYVQQHPDKALEIFNDAEPQTDKELNAKILPLFVELLGNNVGSYDESHWGALEKLYEDAGLLKESVDLSTVYDDTVLR